MPVLQNGDAFPSITIDLVGGRRVTLPDHLAGNYGVILLYRGSWCPYCNAQLAAFGRAYDALHALGVEVVAVSVDDEPTSAGLVDKYRLPFAVGYGADVDAIASLTGAYTNDHPKHFHSTGFILDPAGAVITAVYSSGAIGRLVPEDVIGFLRYVKSHSESAEREPEAEPSR